MLGLLRSAGQSISSLGEDCGVIDIVVDLDRVRAA
jgi:hypothetical protein